MEVRPGYKLTEVGVIPKDWEVRTIRDVSNMVTVGFVGSMAHLFTGNGVPLLRGQNVLPGRIDLTDSKFISLHTHNLWKKSALRGGDIVIVRVGYPGTSAVVPRDIGNANAASLVVVRPDSSCVDSDFMCWVLLSDIGRKQVKAALVGGAQQVINIRTAASLLLPVPAKTEQRAIVAALSHVDALLGGLDRVIAKKRDLKQAAMQQLLTGQTRLPGFHGKWEVKRLGDLAEIICGGTPRTNESSYWNGGIKWCTPTDITRHAGKYLTETERTISRDGLNSSGAALLPVGALLLCSRATIGELKIAGTPICTNQGFKSLVCRPEVSNEFLYYKLLTMKQQMVERAFGSTFLEISTRNVSALEVATPSHDEHIAIAAVLSDMDAELSALEVRRDKTRALKQGMMQELLTGRTRLV